MNIFLSGKMDEYGAWRDAILGTSWDYETKRRLPRWEMVSKAGAPNWDYACPDGSPPQWPRQPNTLVLDLHNFVGPYRVTYEDPGGPCCNSHDSKHLGYFHGSTWRGQHGVMDDGDRAVIVEECLDAICRANIVFAYINRPDCFGTIAELGFARALGTFVYLFVEDGVEWEWDDYWFVDEMASVRAAQPWNLHSAGAPEDRAERVRWLMRDALVRWTAGPTTAAGSKIRALAPVSDLSVRADEYAHSFSQIARWTSDPRVRHEAERMLRRIGSR